MCIRAQCGQRTRRAIARKWNDGGRKGVQGTRLHRRALLRRLLSVVSHGSVKRRRSIFPFLVDVNNSGKDSSEIDSCSLSTAYSGECSVSFSENDSLTLMRNVTLDVPFEDHVGQQTLCLVHRHFLTREAESFVELFNLNPRRLVKKLPTAGI